MKLFERVPEQLEKITEADIRSLAPSGALLAARDSIVDSNRGQTKEIMAAIPDLHGVISNLKFNVTVTADSGAPASSANGPAGSSVDGLHATGGLAS